MNSKFKEILGKYKMSVEEFQHTDFQKIVDNGSVDFMCMLNNRLENMVNELWEEKDKV